MWPFGGFVLCCLTHHNKLHSTVVVLEITTYWEKQNKTLKIGFIFSFEKENPTIFLISCASTFSLLSFCKENLTPLSTAHLEGKIVLANAEKESKYCRLCYFSQCPMPFLFLTAHQSPAASTVTAKLQSHLSETDFENRNEQFILNHVAHYSVEIAKSDGSEAIMPKDKWNQFKAPVHICEIATVM